MFNIFKKKPPIIPYQAPTSVEYFEALQQQSSAIDAMALGQANSTQAANNAFAAQVFQNTHNQIINNQIGRSNIYLGEVFFKEQVIKSTKLDKVFYE